MFLRKVVGQTSSTNWEFYFVIDKTMDKNNWENTTPIVEWEKKDCSWCPNREVCKGKCVEDIKTTLDSPIPDSTMNFTADDVVDL